MGAGPGSGKAAPNMEGGSRRCYGGPEFMPDQAGQRASEIFSVHGAKQGNQEVE